MANVYVSLYLSDGEEFKIMKKNGLREVEFLEQVADSVTDVANYGIKVGNGTITGIDNNGELLKEWTLGDIVVNNTRVGIHINGKEYKQYFVGALDYDNASKEYTITLKDTIERLKDITINGTKFISSSHTLSNGVLTAIGGGASLLTIVTEALNTAGYTADEVTASMQEEAPSDDETVAEYLGWTAAENTGSYYATQSVFSLIDEVCRTTQLWAVSDENGKIKFLSARPHYSYSQDVVMVYPKDYHQDLTIESTPGNVFDSVSYINRKASPSIETIYSGSIPAKSDANQFGYTSTTLSSGATAYAAFVQTTAKSEYSFPTLELYNALGVYPTSITISYTDNSTSTARMVSLREDNTATVENFAPTTAGNILLSRYSTANSSVYCIVDTIDTDKTVSGVSCEIKEWALNIYETTAKYIQNYSSRVEDSEKGIYTFSWDETNELLTSLLMVRHKRKTVYEFVAKNIADDYVKGIRGANLTLFCDTFKNILGETAVNFLTNGELLSIGDLVDIRDTSDIPIAYGVKYNWSYSATHYSSTYPATWEIVSRRFKYNGAVSQEIKVRESQPKLNILLGPRGATMLTNGLFLNVQLTGTDTDVFKIHAVRSNDNINKTSSSATSGLYPATLNIVAGDTLEIEYLGSGNFTVAQGRYTTVSDAEADEKATTYTDTKKATVKVVDNAITIFENA